MALITIDNPIRLVMHHNLII